MPSDDVAPSDTEQPDLEAEENEEEDDDEEEEEEKETEEEKELERPAAAPPEPEYVPLPSGREALHEQTDDSLWTHAHGGKKVVTSAEGE